MILEQRSTESPSGSSSSRKPIPKRVAASVQSHTDRRGNMRAGW